MPIIPGQAQMISTDVPGHASDQNAGIIGQSIAGLGEKLAQSGLAIFDKIQSAEASDAVFAAKNSDDLASTAYRANLMKTSPDGYFRNSKGERVANADPATDGAYQTVTQNYREWANQRFKDTTDAMPNNIATQSYRQQGSTFFTGEMTRVFTDEQSRRVEFTKNNEQIGSQAISDSLLSYPGTYSNLNTGFYDKAQGMVLKRQQSVSAGVYDAATGKELTAQDLAHMANSNMGGYIQAILDQTRNGKTTNSLPEIQKALAVLEGNDPASYARRKKAKELGLTPAEALDHGLFTISDVMKPADKEHRMRQLIDMSKETTRLDMSNWHRLAEDSQKNAARGVIDPGAAFEQIFNLGAPYVASGQIVNDERIDEALKPFEGQVEFEVSHSHFATKPAAEQAMWRDRTIKYVTNQIQQKLTPDTWGQVGGRILDQMGKKFDSAIESQSAEFKSDSAAFVVKANRPTVGQPSQLEIMQNHLMKVGIANWGNDFAQYVNMVDREVKNKGPLAVKDWRLAPKDFTEWVGTQLTDPKTSNPEAKAFMLSRMYQSAPKTWGRFVDQMIKDKAGGVDTRWEYAKIMPNTTMAKEFISTLMINENVLKKQFDTAGFGQTFDQYRVLVAPKIAPWVQAKMQSANPLDPNYANMSAALTDFYTLKAAQIYMNSGGQATDAADRAYKALVGNSSIVTQTPRGGFLKSVNRGNDARVYPMQTPEGIAISEDTAANLDSWVKSRQAEPKTYQVLQAAPPDDFVARQAASGAKPTEIMDMWYKRIAQDPQWIVDPQTHNGWQIRWLDSYDNSRKVVTVKNKDGARVPLVVPFSQANPGLQIGPPVPGAPKAPIPPAKQPGSIPSTPFEKGASLGGANRTLAGETVSGPASDMIDSDSRAQFIDARSMTEEIQAKSPNAGEVTPKEVQALWYAGTEAEAHAHVNSIKGISPEKKAALQDYVRKSYESIRNLETTAQQSDVFRGAAGKSKKKYHVETKRVPDKSSPTGYSISIKQVFD